MSKYVVIKYAIGLHLCCKILDALIFKQSCNHNSFYHMDYMRTMKNHTLAICKLLYCFERLFSMGCCSKKHDIITIKFWINIKMTIKTNYY